MQTLQNEITRDVLLCDELGCLNPEAAGWSRRPLHVCNLRGCFPRKKKWDYWCITGDRFLFSATIAHVDYFSLAGVYFLEYESSRFAETGAVKLFPSVPVMPETVGGTIRFERRGFRLEFACRDDGLTMTAAVKSLAGKPLEASLDIRRPAEHESLNVVVPWSRRRFQFTSKQHCMPVRGDIQWGDETFSFAPETAFACLDFGRGIWPYHTAWNWASFSGHCGADLVGLNMGAKWTDGTGMNENGIWLNNRLYKIFDDIVFEYDDRDFMRPWRMRTEASDAVRLEFVPFYDKSADVNLVLLRSKVHQMFGRYSGTLTVDGRVVRVENMLGWAEEHRARW